MTAIQNGVTPLNMVPVPTSGRTMQAAAKLMRQVGANVVGSACIIELSFLKGRDRLDMPCSTLVAYDE